ncbi:DUF1684 domain-containing protein [Haladaptatus pallidirubidus]|uniref:DUF1684 domain-containing protein n=1 Tax=Haladaptatus pallidirubidus TaxID=1008152 RepID=A0AAV3UFJ0_9EURY|nr:DUF1684 domain-containing protein [Haladaptatus pallidirubidus]
MTDASDVDELSEDEWREELQNTRREKDEFFGDHPQSPIPPEKRDEFDGLTYFDPAPEYQVTATVESHEDREPIDLEMTSANPQRYLRTMTLHFEVDGQEQSLAVYQQDGQESLFVPFRDKTTGQQSYENGRYLELHPDRELTDSDEVTLDFNLAYSPFCAFSETFACPLPPEENWLDVAIRAGERKWDE